MLKLKYDEYSLIVLLISLLFVLLVYPFFDVLVDSALILKILLSIVLVAAVAATTHKPVSLAVASLLALAALFTSWGEFFDDTFTWITVNVALEIAFLAYVIWVHLIKIMTTPAVTKNLLFGSLCVYLLIGLMMSFVYILISINIPNAFDQLHFPLTHYNRFSVDQHFFRYAYFSFVTLTTLGYGDIHPIAQPAQAFAYIEAVAGQFYLTVLVARLIGLHVSNKRKI